MNLRAYYQISRDMEILGPELLEFINLDCNGAVGRMIEPCKELVLDKSCEPSRRFMHVV